MNTPERRSSTPSPDHGPRRVVMMEGQVPLLQASRSLAVDFAKASRALDEAKRMKPENMAFQGGSMKDAEAFYTAKQRERAYLIAQAEGEIDALNAQQGLISELGQFGAEDPTDYLNSEEARLAGEQAADFALKKQLEYQHASSRDHGQQIILATQLRGLETSIEDRMRRMGAVVGVRGRFAKP